MRRLAEPVAYLRHQVPRDSGCVAGGSGLAPMVSIARGAAQADPPPMTQSLQAMLMLKCRVPFEQLHCDRFFEPARAYFCAA
jgi:hypothetical protein